MCVCGGGGGREREEGGADEESGRMRECMLERGLATNEKERIWR